MKEFPAPPKVHVVHVPGADPERDAMVQRQAQEADVCVHEDPERHGVMWNWLNAMDCAVKNDADLPWTVIIQDDTEPLRGWQQHLERCVTNAPTPIIGLTHMGGFGERAAAKGAPYGIGHNLVWGAGIAYHRSQVAPMAEWARKVWDKTGYVHDDVMVAAWAYRQKFYTCMASRAIFGLPRFKSLLNHNTPVRHPFLTIEDDGPAWTVRPRSVPTRRDIGTEIQMLAEVEV